MAVQKSKKTPSKRNMRRSHDSLKNSAIGVDSSTGEAHLRHHITPNGFYRGKKIVEQKKEQDD